MEKFEKFKSKVIPFPVENVDTDQIIPARFLTSISKSGYKDALFRDWRFNKDGSINPEFVMNFPQYVDAKILLTGKNFGCGSSREHAAWALRDNGIKVVIAESFGDIFKMNSLKNGLVIIQLKPDQISEIFELFKIDSESLLEVDLEAQLVSFKDKAYPFEIDGFRKLCMINGYDDLEYMLSKLNEIVEYEKKFNK
jgi:3-isopropylmalate/(R)-2-methylmalate dehydratase small subunit